MFPKVTKQSYCIEVCNDLIQQTQTFHALVVGLQLGVKVGEVDDRSEHDTNVTDVLVVQFLGETPARDVKFAIQIGSDGPQSGQAKMY